MTIEEVFDTSDDANQTQSGPPIWPAPDRDAPQLGDISSTFAPGEKLAIFLQMEGHQGRSEEDVKAVTGSELSRPRRWHKIFERMGVLYPGEGVTRLSRVGRMLRDVAAPDGLKRLIAREAIEVLKRYQFDNPVERSLPEGCDIHPYFAVLRAAAKLDWKIHWDEVNRSLMWLTHDGDIDKAVQEIAVARSDPDYANFIGKASNDAGLLPPRAHPAEATAPAGKTVEGQVRDQRITPFLKRAGFSELLLESPGAGGGGYWSVPSGVRDIVAASVEIFPVKRTFSTQQDWIEWFCEGTAGNSIILPTVAPLKPAVPVPQLTLKALREALTRYEPELTFSDYLLATIIAALRSGDGRPFIILRGVSGTGKSKLVSAIAKAVYGAASVSPPHLTFIEVRPDWTDGSFLLGHFDPLSGQYVRQRFLDALITAQAELNANPFDPAPVFVCLDEMNLARVEYYLADCLSAMESGSEIALDVRSDASVSPTIKWPPNLFLFGTINVDETTLSISDKVLDRAQVIDTSDIDLKPELSKWLAAEVGLDDAERKRIALIIGGSWEILRKVHAHFGFRTAKSIIKFIAEAKASSDGAISIDDAIDAQLFQKVLVKLRGEGEHWALALNDLRTCLSDLQGRRYANGAIEKMILDLQRLGSFQFWS